MAFSSDQSIRYQHHALPDASTYVRLLKTVSVFADGTELAFVCSAFALDQAPEYVAISYTWGPSHPLRRIRIDDRVFDVRHNAWQALCKARSHYPNSFIWIDSACIDQEDVSEKSHQVAQMGQIYKCAASVAIVLSKDPGDVLHSAVRQFGSIPNDQLDTLLTHQQVGDWLRFLSKAHFNILSFELAEYVNLPYWKRAWIVQEICLGKQVQILTDLARLSFSALCVLFEHLHGLANTRTNVAGGASFANVKRTSRLASRQLAGHSVVSILQDFHSTQCSDPRDRIYAFLELVDWTKYNARPRPDYRLSRFDLAIEIMDYFTYERKSLRSILMAARVSKGGEFRRPSTIISWTEDLLKALEIGHDNEHVSHGLAVRSADFTEYRRVYGSVPPGREVQTLSIVLKEVLYCYLGMTEDNRTVIPTVSERHLDACHMSHHEEYIRSGSNSLHTLFTGGTDPLQVGRICSKVRTGDLLVEIQICDMLSLQRTKHLVLRAHNTEVYQIVGQAVLEHGFAICGGTDGDCACPASLLNLHTDGVLPQLTLFFDKADLLVWLAQDRAGAGSQTYDVVRFDVSRTPDSSYALIP